MSLVIDDLPVELLVQILRNVEQRTLHQAILTCKKWEEVIRNHLSWNVRVSVCKSSDFCSLTRLTNVNRKLNIELTLNDNFDNTSVDIFEEIGCEVTQLIWSKCNSKKGFVFPDLLKSFPNLKYIRVINVNVPETPDDHDLPTLEKLKTLETFECNVNIVRYFRTSTLKSLEMGKINLTPTCSTQHLADFVLRQENLTRLSLNGISNMFFQQLCDTTPNHRTIPFKLHHLIVNVVGETNHSSELYNFFKIHSKTLKKLDLCGVIPISICERIFSKLKSLKILAFNDREYRTGLDDCLSIKVNFERLEVRFNNYCPQALSRLCKSVPNVKKLILELNDGSHRQLSIISTTLSNITTLYVKNFGNSFNEMKLPNLTSLHIEDLTNEDGNWDAITKNNCRVTVLCIKFVGTGRFNLNHIETITRNWKLHILKIGMGFYTDTRFVKIIRKNCSNLEVLDLHRACGLQYYQWNCFAPLRLCEEIHFPISFLKGAYW